MIAALALSSSFTPLRRNRTSFPSIGTLACSLGTVLLPFPGDLVVASVAESGGDAVGGGDEVRAERVDELLEGDQGAGGHEVDGGDDFACLVAHRCGDRVQLGGELLVIDGEPRRLDLVELVA